MKTMSMIPVRTWLAAVAVCWAALVAGCSSEAGPKLHTVSGTVKFDGQPLKEGRITFQMTGPGGRSYTGPITDGAYKVQAEAGSARVEIIASRPIPGKFDKSNGTPEQMGEMYIPKKYNSASTLKADIKPESQEIPFDLTK